MRRNNTIERIWRSGLYIGANRADSRVTIDRDWTLHSAKTPGTAMEPRRQPGRWYQDAAHTQNEVELPRQLIRQVQVDRRLGSDTAQFTITCWNADPDNGPNKNAQGQFSQRRTFEGNEGLRLIAAGAARWPQLEPNDWSAIHGGGEAHSYGRIAQGNMVRIYQGYGSWYKTLADGLTDDNLVRTVVGIIDTVDTDTDGNIEIAGRCVGSLLVDQTCYPPLIPIDCYPTQFFSKSWNQATTGNPRGYIPTRTNYRDLADIIRLLAIWSGFYFPGAPNSHNGRWPAILGGIEDTGIDATSVIGADVFDKKPPIDAMKTIREMVGYLTWIDQEGGLRFQSPNIWEAGNFDYDGKHHRFAFDLDEEVNLLSLRSSSNKALDRSSITVAMADPYRNGKGTVKLASFNTNTTSVKNQLHGMNIPAMIGLDTDIPLKEMITMAELIGVRIWFLRRRGTISAPALPLIDPDDQIRAWDRITYDHYLHRVEGVVTNHDLDSGEYRMDLNTHWLGADNTDWAIRVGPNGHVVYNTHASAGGTVTRTPRFGHVQQPPTVADYTTAKSTPTEVAP